MKNIYLIIVILVILSSCKKGKSEDPIDGKLLPITFNVNDLGQVIGEIGKSGKVSGKVSALNAGSANSGADHIYYAVYKENKSLVKFRHLTRSDTNFGTITDTLPQGIYNFVFLATKLPVTVNPTDQYAEFTLPGTDAFYKSILLAVDDQPNKTIDLKRIVSLLEIKSEDPIPFSIKKITGSVTSRMVEAFYNHMDLTNGNPKTSDYHSSYYDFEFTIDPSEYGKPFTRNVFYFVDEYGFTGEFDISTHNSLNEVVTSKSIKKVVLERNKKTAVSGNLFNSPTSGAVVNLPDTNWINKPVVHF